MKIQDWHDKYVLRFFNAYFGGRTWKWIKSLFKNNFKKFANKCVWLGCDEIWNGKKKSSHWFCSHECNLDNACIAELCPLLGEEHEFKRVA